MASCQISHCQIDLTLIFRTNPTSLANRRLLERREKGSWIDPGMILANSQINPCDLMTGSIAKLID